MKQKIQAYWDARALEAETSTTNDIYLKVLESKTLIHQLSNVIKTTGDQAIDIGCGDGTTTVKLAEALPFFKFTGIDYSPNMIASAKQKNNNINWMVGDITDISDVAPSFNVAITDRCLINLENKETQFKAIKNIYSLLKKGGVFLSIENFTDGHDNMNNARKSIGLIPIPIRWHNLYFDIWEFQNACIDAGFVLENSYNFSSSYYLATRVLYPAVCLEKNITPDYSSLTHKLAVSLPYTGNFSPIKLYVWRKS